MTTNIIITGVAGFIGSTLCERLLEDDCRVIGIDSFDNYYDPVIKQKNLASCLQHPRFKLIQDDLSALDWQQILPGIDNIFHLAARPGVRATAALAPDYWQNNIQTTLDLLEAVRNYPIKKFILASTSSVYGLADKLPLNEADPVRPISFYGISKLAAEKLCLLYSATYGVPCTILRYFSVYGPKQRPDMAFDKFIKALLAGNPLTVYGDGNQTRDFTYISDIVEGSLRAMRSESRGEVINLGGGTQISLQRAIDVLEKITSRKAQINFEPPLHCEPRHTLADISKARQILGYQPQIAIEDGLIRQYQYLRDK